MSEGPHQPPTTQAHQQALPMYKPEEVQQTGQALPGFANEIESQHLSLSQHRKTDVIATDRGRWKADVTLHVTIAREAAQSLQNTKYLFELMATIQRFQKSW